MYLASSNTYNSNTYDRTYLSNTGYKAGSAAIVAANIIVAGSDGLYKHLKSGAAFDITMPILYASSACNANATNNGGYLIIPFTVTTTQSITLTAHLPVYIKGQLSGTTFTPIGTAPLTQTVPTTADGYEYMLLGKANTTTVMYLLPEHPIYAYRNGKFGTVAHSAEYPLLSTSQDGLAPQLDNNANHFLNGQGEWTRPITDQGLTLVPYSGSSTADEIYYDGSTSQSVSVASDNAITNISRSGTTFTATRANGSTFTFTQQDNNTWTANSASAAGYVASGSGQADKMWATDSGGNPAWRNINWKMYNSVTELSLTSGSCSIIQAFNAMDNNSILICDAGNFTATSVPYTTGLVKIIKQGSARWDVSFHPKNSNAADYHMYPLSGENGPSGVWSSDGTIPGFWGYNGSLTNYTDYSTNCWRVGDNGYLYLNVTFTSYTNGTLIGTMLKPRPIMQLDFNVIPNAGANGPYLRLKTNGEVYLYGFTASTHKGVRALISFPCSTEHPNYAM